LTVIQFDLPPDAPPAAAGKDCASAWFDRAAGDDRAAALDEPRIAIDPEDVSNGLGKLVLTLVEVIRQVLERQALRRIEAGSLTDEEIERLGMTFLRLSEEMERLKTHFGLEGEELNLDLGPLGKLL